jgi:hypothetical protein
MRKSARRLAKHKPKLETLREVVDEAVEAVVVVEVEQVVEILMGMGNVHLGMIIPQRAPTLESQIFEGTWKMHCSKCGGWNETHTTKYHDEQQQSAATFKVPPHHPYWPMLGKIYPAIVAGVTFAPTGAGAASTGSTTSGSVLASLTGVLIVL